MSKGGAQTNLKEIKGIGDKSSKPSFYIVNFEEGGFCIISADKRTYPVLAYSSHSKFDLNLEKYPAALVYWLADQDNHISEIRNGNVKTDINYSKYWNADAVQRILTSKLFATRNMKNYRLIYSKGPLLSTTWGQGDGYNNSAPYKNCSSYNNGRVPVGCVATAVGQVMKFHNYPNNYNWSIMPNEVYTSTVSSDGTNEIATLLRDIGDAVGMDWGCDGSGVETKKAANVLRNTFGYSSANYTTSLSKLEREIRLGYPVVLKGGRAQDWVIFKVYKDGHAWVCDGCKVAEMDIRYRTTRGDYDWRTVEYKTYHMNWGWNGYCDGWYHTSKNKEGSFNYKMGMIYNIRK